MVFRRKVRIRRRRLPSSNSDPTRSKHEERYRDKPRRRRRKKNKRQRNKNRYTNDYLLTPEPDYDYDNYDNGNRFSQDFELSGERRRPLSATLGYDPDGMAYIRYINKRKLDTRPSKQLRDY